MKFSEENSGKDEIQIMCELITETARRVIEGEISKQKLQDLTGLSNETFQMIMEETRHGTVILPRERLGDILIDGKWQLNRLKKISLN